MHDLFYKPVTSQIYQSSVKIYMCVCVCEYIYFFNQPQELEISPLSVLGNFSVQN